MTNYIVYNALNPLYSTKPFDVGILLLNELNISSETTSNSQFDPGFNYSTLNSDLFVQIFMKPLLDATINKQTIIALEDSSYLGLNYVKYLLASNFDNELANSNVTCKDLPSIVHINSLFCSKNILQHISSNLKLSFENFYAGFYIGTDIDARVCKNYHIENIFASIKLNKVNMFQYAPSGFDIFTNSPNVAQKMAGKILCDAFDSGCDFLIVNDIRTFTFFDTYQKKIAKTIGREISISILTLSQVILMALGVTDKAVLGFDKHSVMPTFI